MASHYWPDPSGYSKETLGFEGIDHPQHLILVAILKSGQYSVGTIVDGGGESAAGIPLNAPEAGDHRFLSYQKQKTLHQEREISMGKA